jgi:hypothetical protein
MEVDEDMQVKHLEDSCLITFGRVMVLGERKFIVFIN